MLTGRDDHSGAEPTYTRQPAMVASTGTATKLVLKIKPFRRGFAAQSCTILENGHEN